ncbi:MAG: MFS transporter [Deltaproteobacteria bacterium]|nr:MFS transporter [Deltaproteobacteria bacterium]
MFILFRVFFNARFYYPVFTVLFLDFGLTLEQFALLNVAWAVTIVLLEVPSGALADTLGRRNLLVVAGILMVMEMALLCFVPRGNANILFGVFLLNRILSGAAEAAASGADEALAYDSLQKEGCENQWGRVLEKQMRMQAAAYLIAMSLGAAVYDPVLMQVIVDWLGFEFTVSREVTLRLPVVLTFGMAVLTLLTALLMREIRPTYCGGPANLLIGSGRSVIQAFKLTLKAGSWILKTPFALGIILIGVVFDGCLRMAVTLTSQYYRLIHLPEASFGLIGSAIAVVGLFIPRMAQILAEKRSPQFNLMVMTVPALIGLAGMALFLPALMGVVPIVLISSAMSLLRFFQSDYLNRITTSDQRSTVLSFKGLSMNLAYGAVGIFYSFLVSRLRSVAVPTAAGPAPEKLEERVFMAAMGVFPWVFAAALVVVLVYFVRTFRRSGAAKRPS